jgi:hypothetical protein
LEGVGTLLRRSFGAEDGGELDGEGGAFADLAFDADAAAVALDDLAAVGKP